MLINNYYQVLSAAEVVTRHLTKYSLNSRFINPYRELFLKNFYLLETAFLSINAGSLAFTTVRVILKQQNDELFLGKMVLLTAIAFSYIFAAQELILLPAKSTQSRTQRATAVVLSAKVAASVGLLLLPEERNFSKFAVVTALTLYSLYKNRRSAWLIADEGVTGSVPYGSSSKHFTLTHSFSCIPSTASNSCSMHPNSEVVHTCGEHGSCLQCISPIATNCLECETLSPFASETDDLFRTNYYRTNTNSNFDFEKTYVTISSLYSLFRVAVTAIQFSPTYRPYMELLATKMLVVDVADFVFSSIHLSLSQFERHATIPAALLISLIAAGTIRSGAPIRGIKKFGEAFLNSDNQELSQHIHLAKLLLTLTTTYYLSRRRSYAYNRVGEKHSSRFYKLSGPLCISAAALALLATKPSHLFFAYTVARERVADAISKKGIHFFASAL